MRRLVWVGLGLLLWPQPAHATQPGRCNQLAEITTSQLLSDAPARVCSVELFSTDNNSWAYVYDAPSLTATRVGIAEPGAGSATAHAFLDFGVEGFVTQFGLGVEIADADGNASGTRVLIRWGR